MESLSEEHVLKREAVDVVVDVLLNVQDVNTAILYQCNGLCIMCMTLLFTPIDPLNLK